MECTNVIKIIVKRAHLHWFRLQKTWLSTPTPVLYPCRYSFSMSTHVCNVFSITFVKSPGVPVWMLFLILMLFWDTSRDFWQCKKLSFYFTQCKMILRSIKAQFLEPEKAMFIGSTLVPMFTIITPGPYTHSKQSKAFHAKYNLKVNR